MLIELSLMQEGSFTLADLEALPAEDVIDYFALLQYQAQKKREHDQEIQTIQDQWVTEQLGKR